MDNRLSKKRFILPGLAILMFTMLSVAILPYPGLDDDEAAFSIPISVYGTAVDNVRLFGRVVPLMLVSYAGTLKTWLYTVIFQFVHPSVWSVRLPMVMTGIATILLSWEWVRRVAGIRAAAFTALLLAADSTFILTNTFDWGPVALQHLLFVAGLVAIQRWLESVGKARSWKWLLVAFFLWGLGLWDKALMIWVLIGLAAASICVYPREFFRSLRGKPLLLAAAALLVGALPLVHYNIRSRGRTAIANTKPSLEPVAHNLIVLKRTLDGSILQDIIVATTPGPNLRTANTPPARLSLTLEQLFGQRPTNFMIPALVLALGCVPFVSAEVRRLLLFILAASLACWLQMATNYGTGGSAHHVVLFWPFPAAFIGIALAGVAARLSRRATHAITATVALIVCGSVLNTNYYLANLIRNGTPVAWTDAMHRLADSLSPWKSSPIATVDWGYINGLRLLSRGQLRLTPVLLPVISAQDTIFIQHVDDKQILPEVNNNLRALALSNGYSEEVLRVVYDNEGRPTFEIFRFQKAR